MMLPLDEQHLEVVINGRKEKLPALVRNFRFDWVELVP